MGLVTLHAALSEAQQHDLAGWWWWWWWCCINVPNPAGGKSSLVCRTSWHHHRSSAVSPALNYWPTATILWRRKKCYAPDQGIKRWCASDVCLSVAYIGPKSTERPRKTEIGTEVAHVTRDSDTTFKVKRSKVNLQGAGAYCGVLPHSLL